MMTKTINLAITSFCLLFVFSCSPTEIDPNIYGQWHKSSWVIDQSGETMDVQMDFLFNEDGTYLVDYGSQQEKGVFDIVEQRLYTTEEGQAKKFVEITKLTADSLQFKMNRAGRMETVILVK